MTGMATSLSMLTPLYGGGFWVAYAQACSFYFIVGLFLHCGLPALMHVKSVQTGQRKPWSIQRDALYSLGPLAVKAGVWTAVEWLHKHKLGFLYTGPIFSTPYQVLYLFAVVAVLDYLHDGWFYLTHRLLHWGPLYRHIHYIHHKSNVPSAFTGYSFHVLEALLVFANEFIVCFLFPIHMGLHRIYHIYTTAIHQGGHVGYELAPFVPTLEGIITLAFRGTKGTPLPALNTVQHHDMHHRFPNRHFSLYFTHFDRIFGTLHDKYYSEVERFFVEKHAEDSSRNAAAGKQQQEKHAGESSKNVSRPSSPSSALSDGSLHSLGSSNCGGKPTIDLAETMPKAMSALVGKNL